MTPALSEVRFLAGEACGKGGAAGLRVGWRRRTLADGRRPPAEGVFRQLLRDAAEGRGVEVDVQRHVLEAQVAAQRVQKLPVGDDEVLDVAVGELHRHGDVLLGALLEHGGHVEDGLVLANGVVEAEGGIRAAVVDAVLLVPLQELGERREDDLEAVHAAEVLLRDSHAKQELPELLRVHLDELPEPLALHVEEDVAVGLRLQKVERAVAQLHVRGVVDVARALHVVVEVDLELEGGAVVAVLAAEQAVEVEGEVVGVVEVADAARGQNLLHRDRRQQPVEGGQVAGLLDAVDDDLEAGAGQGAEVDAVDAHFGEDVAQRLLQVVDARVAAEAVAREDVDVDGAGGLVVVRVVHQRDHEPGLAQLVHGLVEQVERNAVLVQHRLVAHQHQPFVAHVGDALAEHGEWDVVEVEVVAVGVDSDVHGRAGRSFVFVHDDFADVVVDAFSAVDVDLRSVVLLRHVHEDVGVDVCELGGRVQGVVVDGEERREAVLRFSVGGESDGAVEVAGAGLDRAEFAGVEDAIGGLASNRLTGNRFASAGLAGNRYASNVLTSVVSITTLTSLTPITIRTCNLDNISVVHSEVMKGYVEVARMNVVDTAVLQNLRQVKRGSDVVEVAVALHAVDHDAPLDVAQPLSRVLLSELVNGSLRYDVAGRQVVDLDGVVVAADAGEVDLRVAAAALVGNVEVHRRVVLNVLDVDAGTAELLEVHALQVSQTLDATLVLLPVDGDDHVVAVQLRKRVAVHGLEVQNQLLLDGVEVVAVVVHGVGHASAPAAGGVVRVVSVGNLEDEVGHGSVRKNGGGRHVSGQVVELVGATDRLAAGVLALDAQHVAVQVAHVDVGLLVQKVVERHAQILVVVHGGKLVVVLVEHLDGHAAAHADAGGVGHVLAEGDAEAEVVEGVVLGDGHGDAAHLEDGLESDLAEVREVAHLAFRAAGFELAVADHGETNVADLGQRLAEHRGELGVELLQRGLQRPEGDGDSGTHADVVLALVQSEVAERSAVQVDGGLTPAVSALGAARLPSLPAPAAFGRVELKLEHAAVSLARVHVAERQQRVHRQVADLLPVEVAGAVLLLVERYGRVQVHLLVGLHGEDPARLVRAALLLRAHAELLAGGERAERAVEQLGHVDALAGLVETLDDVRVHGRKAKVARLLHGALKVGAQSLVVLGLDAHVHDGGHSAVLDVVSDAELELQRHVLVGHLVHEVGKRLVLVVLAVDGEAFQLRASVDAAEVLVDEVAQLGGAHVVGHDDVRLGLAPALVHREPDGAGAAAEAVLLVLQLLAGHEREDERGEVREGHAVEVLHHGDGVALLNVGSGQALAADEDHLAQLHVGGELRVLARQGGDLGGKLAVLGADLVAQQVREVVHVELGQDVHGRAAAAALRRLAEAEGGVLAGQRVVPHEGERVVGDADAHLAHVVVDVVLGKVLVAVGVAVVVDDESGDVVEVVGVLLEAARQLGLAHEALADRALELVAALVRVDLHGELGGDVVDDAANVDEAGRLDVQLQAVVQLAVPEAVEAVALAALDADEHLVRAVAVLVPLDLVADEVLDLVLVGAVGRVHGEAVDLAVVVGELDGELVARVGLSRHVAQLRAGGEVPALVGVHEHVHADLVLVVEGVELERGVEGLLGLEQVAHPELVLEVLPDVGGGGLGRGEPELEGVVLAAGLGEVADQVGVGLHRDVRDVAHHLLLGDIGEVQDPGAVAEFAAVGAGDVDELQVLRRDEVAVLLEGADDGVLEHREVRVVDVLHGDALGLGARAVGVGQLHVEGVVGGLAVEVEEVDDVGPAVEAGLVEGQLGDGDVLARLHHLVDVGLLERAAGQRVGVDAVGVLVLAAALLLDDVAPDVHHFRERRVDGERLAGEEAVEVVEAHRHVGHEGPLLVDLNWHLVGVVAVEALGALVQVVDADEREPVGVLAKVVARHLGQALPVLQRLEVVVDGDVAQLVVEVLRGGRVGFLHVGLQPNHGLHGELDGLASGLDGVHDGLVRPRVVMVAASVHLGDFYLVVEVDPEGDQDGVPDVVEVLELAAEVVPVGVKVDVVHLVLAESGDFDGDGDLAAVADRRDLGVAFEVDVALAFVLSLGDWDPLDVARGVFALVQSGQQGERVAVVVRHGEPSPDDAVAVAQVEVGVGEVQVDIAEREFLLWLELRRVRSNVGLV
ncbi:type I restriction enzymeP M, putative [Babesia caballi]|uniref:Type I restriction enzymeP M, putative n=1 Tax=Babesia caballi TaxID=5871 RepID=A0AAV4M108_BABCB|nr:type I restriction enzymeP M, putative [Babesia caballi]